MKRVKVKGIKYFKRDATSDEEMLEFEERISVEEILNELNIDRRFVGYVIQSGHPVDKDSYVEGEDDIKLIPILSGG